jgi:hypothetical protein
VSLAASSGSESTPVPAGDFPAALVGTWSGGDGKSLTFTEGGLYYGNTGLREGRAVVSGNRISLTPLGGSPVVTTWSVEGGRLYLGTSVYLRDDAASGQVLTISPRNRPPATFGLQYDGTTLTFLNTQGASTGEYIRAG